MQAKKRLFSAILQFCVSILFVIGGVFAWFAIADPHGKFNAGTPNDYTVHAGLQLMVSIDNGVTYKKASETEVTIYPNQKVICKLIYTNKDNTPLNVYGQFQGVDIVYDHEYYYLNTQEHVYEGSPRFDETYWNAHNYYQGLSDYKIDQEKITKDYFKNFIQPMTNVVQYWRGDLPTATAEKPLVIADGLSKSLYTVSLDAKEVKTEYMIFYFNPELYASFNDPAYGTVQLRNSNPFMFQKITVDFKIIFDLTLREIEEGEVQP